MHFEIKLNTQMSSDCKATKSKETVYINDLNGKTIGYLPLYNRNYNYTTAFGLYDCIIHHTIIQHLDYTTVLLYDVCIWIHVRSE